MVLPIQAVEDQRKQDSQVERDGFIGKMDKGMGIHTRNPKLLEDERCDSLMITSQQILCDYRPH